MREGDTSYDNVVPPRILHAGVCEPRGGVPLAHTGTVTEPGPTDTSAPKGGPGRSTAERTLCGQGSACGAELGPPERPVRRDL